MSESTVPAPNPADFSRNDKPGEYTAEITVRGRISIYIKADSREAAQRQVAAEVERMEKDGYVEVYSIDQIEIYRVTKDPPMYRVTRDEKPMQVSRLDAGDKPRAPDKRGF
jgi:hypothetical protein